MELAHLLTGQAILFSSLVATITLTESTRCSTVLRSLTDLPFVRVAGERGAVLLLFALSALFLIVLDFVVSQAKLCGLHKLSRRSKAAKAAHGQAVLITFIAFISAYVFQTLNFRVSNFLGLALVAVNLSTFLQIVGLQLFKTWLYVVYVLSTVLVLCFTYLRNAEKYYMYAVSLVRIK